jgi:acyl carrier protein
MPEQQLDTSGSVTPFETESETETERRVGVIWSAVLGGKPIYRTSHFFQLGGESLLAMRMITRVRRDFGIRVPARTIFDSPTLDRFSAIIDAMQSA